MSTVEVWPDTNTFLHFKSLDELDWSLLTGGAAEVTVTVCSAVMGELDDKKHRGDTAKLRERAKNSIGRLHKWRTADIAPGVRLRLVADEPKVDWDREGLDPRVRDDRIIASVIAQGRGERRAVMTDDMNLGLKAEGRHIEVMNPSDRLPDLKGQQEIIIADLHRQLTAARDKDPKLKLAFADRQGNESQLLRVRLERPSPLDETAIKSAITEKNLELERVARAYREQQAINIKFWPVENEIAPYLKAIPGYLSEYEEWLREELSHNDLVSRTIKIRLVAANLGRGPAEGVHVVVHVPDGPAVKEEFPKRPKQPAPLKEPLSPMDAIRQGIGLSVLPRSYLTEMPKFDLNSSGINIKKVNSFEVAWSTRELSHGLPKDIAPFYCEWPSLDEAKSFTMDYTIHARNLPEPATGQLSIVIESA